jgi:peptide/nickel transport system permease protein
VRFRRYALQRIGAAVGVYCLAVVGTFVICHVIGPIKFSGQAEPLVRARFRAYAHESFGDFLSRLFTGSFAHSLYPFDVSVTDASLVTLSLVGWAMVVGFVIAAPLGFLWDWRPRWTRFVAAPFVYVAASMLTVWVALELSYYVAFKWDLFPVGTYADFFNPPAGAPGGAIDWADHLFLPAFVLCLPFAALYTRIIRAMARNVRIARAAAAEEERSQAAATARRAGLVTIFKGLLRDVGWLMGLALFVEVGFNFRGLGQILNLAALQADTPVVENVLIFATLVAVGIHLLGTLIGGAVSAKWRAGA